MESVLSPSVARDLAEKGTVRSRLYSWEETAPKTLAAYPKGTVKVRVRRLGDLMHDAEFGK